MSNYLNESGVPLSVAVYLAKDFYDYEPNTLSATGLLKPIRQTILAPRVPKDAARIDVQNLVKSRIGTAIHDGVEKVWAGGYYKEAMLKLGYPQKIIERIVVNPDPDNLEPGQIPVYMEQRLYREYMGKRLSGKFDFIAEGRLEDFKSTSVFTWIHGTKTEDYQLQGSIYRWLDQGKRITQDHMAIQFFFTDFMAGKAKSEAKYPPNQVVQQLIPLLPVDETEDFVRTKLTAIQNYKNADEADLPRCNDKELWRKPAQFKYYKNPASRKRSTKNFDSAADAYLRLQEDGNVGVVVEQPGEVIACKFCPAFPICTQKDEYIADGTLKL